MHGRPTRVRSKAAKGVTRKGDCSRLVSSSLVDDEWVHVLCVNPLGFIFCLALSPACCCIHSQQPLTHLALISAVVPSTGSLFLCGHLVHCYFECTRDCWRRLLLLRLVRSIRYGRYLTNYFYLQCPYRCRIQNRWQLPADAIIMPISSMAVGGKDQYIAPTTFKEYQILLKMLSLSKSKMYISWNSIKPITPNQKSH